jgi:hypothetical protein
MASSMTKISSVTVGSSGTSSFDFTAIPQTYTDLVVKISTRSTYTSGTANTIQISLNGSTASFTGRSLEGDGSAVTSGSAARSIGATPSATATASTFSNGELYFPNYTSSNYKSFSYEVVQEDNVSTAYTSLGAGLWSNTAAITSITISTNVNNWAQYTTATLYGVTKYAETGTGSKATGGTVTTSGGYTYHTFFSSGMFTPTATITGAEVLVVAGGGGTQGSVGAGAGAGGLVYASGQSFTSGVGYAAIVGAGGAGAGGSTVSACNGTNSVFSNGTVAIGGGAGNGLTSPSGSGGSGGGAGAPGATAGTGTAGQGNNGGATGSAYSGGGGGAGAAGGTGGANGRGGDGGVGVSTYSAWGAATATGENSAGTYYYAGGGGGSSWNGVSANNIGGQPGLGGGGQGGGGTPVTSGDSNGKAYTGGGGGGDNGGYQWSGGSGIIIVRYTT